MFGERFGGFGVAALALACSAISAPAFAQSTYPTAAGATVKVPGVVPLQCNASGAACAPITTTNPAGPNQVVGNIAHDGVDSGNPVKIGGVAAAPATPPAAVAAGDRVNAVYTPKGAQWISLGTANSVTGIAGSSNALTPLADFDNYYPLAVVNYGWTGTATVPQSMDANGTVVQPALSSTFWSYAAAASGIVSSTADVAVKAAAGASVRNYVCSIDISHDVLSAVSELVIKDNATVMWRGKLNTAVADIAAGAGKLVFTPCLRGSANVAVNVAMVTSVTGGVYVNLTGYTGS